MRLHWAVVGVFAITLGVVGTVLGDQRGRSDEVFRKERREREVQRQRDMWKGIAAFPERLPVTFLSSPNVVRTGDALSLASGKSSDESFVEWIVGLPKERRKYVVRISLDIPQSGGPDLAVRLTSGTGVERSVKHTYAFDDEGELERIASLGAPAATAWETSTVRKGSAISLTFDIEKHERMTYLRIWLGGRSTSNTSQDGLGSLSITGLTVEAVVPNDPS